MSFKQTIQGCQTGQALFNTAKTKNRNENQKKVKIPKYILNKCTCQSKNKRGKNNHQINIHINNNIVM